jgi:dihydrofolate synthase/folylpolyglutamate synthase
MTAPFSEVLPRLYARVPLGMRLGLEAMEAACARAGHPERAFPVVHVAGTNGKGSVCAMIEASLRAGGKKTGLYTSPHLVKLSERIRVNGEPMTDTALAEVLEEALTLGPDLSFFETVTLAGFLAFRSAKVDVAVVEVGIGGRLDATNVVSPKLGVITKIAFDHMDRLGSTLEAIAREKAGIAKPGMKLIVGEMTPEVRAAVEDVAVRAGATTVEETERDPSWVLALEGAHQKANAALAVRVARELNVPDKAIDKGLKGTRWPGRLEHIETERGLAILDGAHNPDGAQALAAYLRSGKSIPPSFFGPHIPKNPPVCLVFGALADKAWTEMLDALVPVSAHRVYVEPHGRAAAPVEALAARHPGETATTVTDALRRARELVGKTGIVVVCGSLYLVGEARAILLGLESDPPVAM